MSLYLCADVYQVVHAAATLLLLAALACPAAGLSELYVNRQWFAFRDVV